MAPWLQVSLVSAAIIAMTSTALVLDTGPGWEPLPTSSFGDLPTCEADANLQWRHETGAHIDTSTELRIATNAIIIACPWTPGTLTVTLRGTTAAGIGTRAVLTQGAERLLDIELRDEECAFTVDVPASGQLLLAFVNDYYDPPEDRNLWVSGLEFTPRAP
jgi:hypothetical protein